MAWKGERNLHIDGKIWKYKIGSSIAIKSPEGESFFVKFFDFLRIMSIGFLLTDGLEAKPSDVKRYIEKHILKNKKDKP
jgi:hypothetical protein